MALAAGLRARVMQWVNSETGPKTTHFWGPVSNAGIVFAAIADTQKPPDIISEKFTAVLAVYSMFFMRFAWMVRPRNYLMLATHIANEGAQCTQLYRKWTWNKEQEALAAAKAGAVGGAGAASKAE